MKATRKITFALICTALLAFSFIAGSNLKEKECMNERAQQCRVLLSFAIDKAETEDLSDQDVMEALISNVYAAYQFCDSPVLSGQLHDLWNELMFENGCYVGREDILAERLYSLSEGMK